MGDLAFVTAEVLSVVDVSDPHSPQLLSFTQYGAPTYDGTIVDNLAFLARTYHDPPSGLLIVDVSDPALPYEISSCGEWDSTGVAVDSSYAYTAGRDGLHVVDVSDPALPIPIGFFEAAWSSSYVTRVAVADGLAVVAPELEPLHVIDIAEPHSPAEAAVFEEMHFSPTDVAFERGRVLVSNDGPGILRIIDVTAPHAPFEVGASGLDLHARGVAVAGDLAYVAATTGGVAIFDVSGCDAIIFRDDFESGDTTRWPIIVP